MSTIEPKIIAVDFDGTCVTHDFPDIGKEIGAPSVLRDLVAAGHKLILWTMRSDDPENGRTVLTDALEWFKGHGIELYGANVNPGQHWSKSPKAYAHLYLDDAALGAPLTIDAALSVRPFIDWNITRTILQNLGYLP